MAKGISIHIGVNSVNPVAYGGWDGPLVACEADAEDMFAIAIAEEYSAKKLLTKQATRSAVLNELHAAAEALATGDILLVTYSGHGGQVVDKNRDEKDNLDETWCLYDGQLIDDELFSAWARFKQNVRIFVLSDSCHSGTVTRVATNVVNGVSVREDTPAPGNYLPRQLPRELVGRAYRAQKELYDGLQKEPPKREGDVNAHVLLISGCQDPQTSMDGPFNGAFTGALLRVWNDGAFKGTYRNLHKKIQQQLPLTQQPNLTTFGNGKPFADRRPFEI